VEHPVGRRQRSLRAEVLPAVREGIRRDVHDAHHGRSGKPLLDRDHCGSFPAMRIAVLGTGVMGAPIARHLAAAGHEVRAWNRTRGKAEGLGGEVAASPAEAVTGAEVVLTILTDGPAVDETMQRALPAMAAGTIWGQ